MFEDCSALNEFWGIIKPNAGNPKERKFNLLQIY